MELEPLHGMCAMATLGSVGAEGETTQAHASDPAVARSPATSSRRPRRLGLLHRDSKNNTGTDMPLSPPITAAQTERTSQGRVALSKKALQIEAIRRVERGEDGCD